MVISYLLTPCFCSLAKESVVNDAREKNELNYVKFEFTEFVHSVELF